MHRTAAVRSQQCISAAMLETSMFRQGQQNWNYALERVSSKRHAAGHERIDL